MTMLPVWVKPTLTAVAFVATFGFGMIVESWRRDSGELEEVKDAKARYTKAVERSESVAEKVQKELDRLEKKRAILTKEIYHETERTEYRCVVPDSGRLLYDRAAHGDTSATGDLQKPMPDTGGAKPAP